MNARDIRNGRERKRLGISLGLIGRFFRRGVTRERVRQIEASKKLTAPIINDYRKALGEIIERRDRLENAISRSSTETGPLRDAKLPAERGALEV